MIASGTVAAPAAPPPPPGPNPWRRLRSRTRHDVAAGVFDGGKARRPVGRGVGGRVPAAAGVAVRRGGARARGVPPARPAHGRRSPGRRVAGGHRLRPRAAGGDSRDSAADRHPAGDRVGRLAGGGAGARRSGEDGWRDRQPHRSRRRRGDAGAPSELPGVPTSARLDRRPVRHRRVGPPRCPRRYRGRRVLRAAAHRARPRSRPSPDLAGNRPGRREGPGRRPDVRSLAARPALPRTAGTASRAGRPRRGRGHSRSATWPSPGAPRPRGDADEAAPAAPGAVPQLSTGSRHPAPAQATAAQTRLRRPDRDGGATPPRGGGTSPPATAGDNAGHRRPRSVAGA